MKSDTHRQPWKNAGKEVYGGDSTGKAYYEPEKPSRRADSYTVDVDSMVKEAELQTYPTESTFNPEIALRGLIGLLTQNPIIIDAFSLKYGHLKF